MFQKISDTIMVTGRGRDDELPQITEIHDSEAHRDSGALILGRPLMVEEVPGSFPGSACTPQGPKNWSRYPYVRMQLGSAREDEFHLDTGSPTSFISRDYLEQARIPIPPVGGKRCVVTDASGGAAVVHETPVQLKIHVKGTDAGGADFDLCLQAVKRWNKHFLNHPCDGQECPGSRGTQCGRRRGLMGRDLLYGLTSGEWSFTSSSGQFFPTGGGGGKVKRRLGGRW